MQVSESSNLAEVCEATIKHVPEVPISPCWWEVNLEGTLDGDEPLVGCPAVAPGAWGTCRLTKALIWVRVLSLPFSLAISHVPSPLTQWSQLHLKERAGVRSKVTSLQEEWAGGTEPSRKRRGLLRRLVWNNLSRHLVKADVWGWADSSESFFLDRWSQKAQAERKYYVPLKGHVFSRVLIEYCGRRWPEAGMLSACPISSSSYVSLCFISLFLGTGFWVRWLRSWVWPRMAIRGVDNPTSGDGRGWDCVNKGRANCLENIYP